MDNRTKVICVVGPTASGKTEIAARLARELGGEVVGADSMQIYRGLDIGTAKPTEQEMLEVPHYMINVVEPGERYSVARYVSEASRVVDEIASRGRVPVIAGGTGLYISSLVRGFSFENGEKCVTMDEKTVMHVRRRLEEMYDRFGRDRMWRLLRQRDPVSARGIHPNDRKRVVRALERSFEARTKGEADAENRSQQARYNALWFGLDYRDRALLYERINRRVDGMLQAGVLDEARWLRGIGGTAAQAIGYKELYPALDDPALLDECVEVMKRATRRYAKRQLTWFRIQEKVTWFFRDETCTDEILRVSTGYARNFLYNQQ